MWAVVQPPPPRDMEEITIPAFPGTNFYLLPQLDIYGSALHDRPWSCTAPSTASALQVRNAQGLPKKFISHKATAPVPAGSPRQPGNPEPSGKWSYRLCGAKAPGRCSPHPFCACAISRGSRWAALCGCRCPFVAGRSALSLVSATVHRSFRLSPGPSVDCVPCPLALGGRARCLALVPERAPSAGSPGRVCDGVTGRVCDGA